MEADTLCREEVDLQSAVAVLLCEATDLGIDRRNLQREPYLKKVLIQRDSGPAVTGFTREISDKGVGLLHSFALEPKDIVEVLIEGPHQMSFRLQMETKWCSPLGDGWYASGGQFIARLDS
jgi:hypothetical protein